MLTDPRTHIEAQPVISDGVAEAIDSARAAFKAQISRTETDTASDTATCSCSDFTNSPFGDPGLPCRASFLLCTACPNAVITPRHLSRLAYLHHTLKELKGGAGCRGLGPGLAQALHAAAGPEEAMRQLGPPFGDSSSIACRVIHDRARAWRSSLPPNRCRGPVVNRGPHPGPGPRPALRRIQP